MTKTEYISTIKAYKTHSDLVNLWSGILEKETPGWQPGIAFEYFVLRAFEIEGAYVDYPYDVDLFGENVEQIDGAVHIQNIGLTVIVECKNYSNKGVNVNVEPLAKLRNQLLRRPPSCIGCVFSTSGFTKPAATLAHFSLPQSIILWQREDIIYCLENECFVEGLEKKIKFSSTHGHPNLNLTKSNKYE